MVLPSAMRPGYDCSMSASPTASSTLIADPASHARVWSTSIDLVMRAKVHEESLVTFPTEKDAQIIVDAEGPVSVEVAHKLVRSQKRIM